MIEIIKKHLNGHLKIFKFKTAFFTRYFKCKTENSTLGTFLNTKMTKSAYKQQSINVCDNLFKEIFKKF